MLSSTTEKNEACFPLMHSFCCVLVQSSYFQPCLLHSPPVFLLLGHSGLLLVATLLEGISIPLLFSVLEQEPTLTSSPQLKTRQQKHSR